MITSYQPKLDRCSFSTSVSLCGELWISQTALAAYFQGVEKFSAWKEYIWGVPFHFTMAKLFIGYVPDVLQIHSGTEIDGFVTEASPGTQPMTHYTKGSNNSARWRRL